ncbi:MAG: acylneuraminate cytidylyltransferase family protein [Thermodesulfovibrionales bacterium]|nr:acylneuraminate cytidylyltransferase family protein [Thermodesulfovibrionales bacterium]
MDSHKEILALIPARGGSKRIPRKNIRELWGKPLLAYSIEVARRSKVINRVICTTDDHEIADIARQYGAEVPFIRPAEFAADQSGDTEFYMHAIAWLREQEGYHPDIITNLRPTNPLRRVEVVDDILETLLRRNDVDSIRSVCRSSISVFLMRTINPESGLIDCPVNVPREGPFQTAKQPLPQSFLLSSYLDATWVEAVLRTQRSLGQKMLPYILNENPIDLDTEDDWSKLLSQYSSYDAYLAAQDQSGPASFRSADMKSSGKDL